MFWQQPVGDQLFIVGVPRLRIRYAPMHPIEMKASAAPMELISQLFSYPSMISRNSAACSYCN